MTVSTNLQQVHAIYVAFGRVDIPAIMAHDRAAAGSWPSNNRDTGRTGGRAGRTAADAGGAAPPRRGDDAGRPRQRRI